ncbi:Sulfotransferase family protein [Desulfonatronum zhilinae]|nr:Sulfotransferase family protein [Desulfonatronum zhilinae]
MKSIIFKKKWRKLYFMLMKINIECRSVFVKINPSPIFIIGNQKSGTSAISALLASATGCTVSIDLSKEWLYKRKGYLLVKEGKWTFADFVERNKLDFSRDIVKEANLTLFYEDLVETFPQSKFVFIARDPRSNIRSILNRIKVPGHLESLERWDQKPHIAIGWEKVVNGAWLGLDGDNYISMLAQRWNLMSDVYIQNKNSIILSRYEDFLVDKIGEIKRIAGRLHLNPHYDISNKINIQYQPRGNREENLRLFYGIKNLERIEKICRNNMTLLGYCR